MATVSDRTVEENERLKEKLDALHEQNAALTSQNHYLKTRMEKMNLELMQSNTRVSIFSVFIYTKPPSKLEHPGDCDS